MIAAARKAARGLKRDFGEVEKLQVSLKGPGNFVSAADRRAEETLMPNCARRGRATASWARRAAAARAPTRPTPGSSIRSTAPRISSTASRNSPSRSALEREGTVVAGVIYNPANEDMFIAEKGKGAFLNDQRMRVAARRNSGGCVIALRAAALGGRGDIAQSRRKPA